MAKKQVASHPKQADPVDDASEVDTLIGADIIERGDEPAVTVVCLTYNHEDYIRQALDSFLMQETTFRFQIFVGEDKGPDTTADIVREYAARYPGIVIPFIREVNMGAQRNLMDMCRQAGTTYIAFCEGDDFWTDPTKLQKQYDLMEANQDLAGCFHNTEIQSEEDWYLGAYYRPDKQGRRLIPFSIPRYDTKLRTMRIGYYIRLGPAHTSSMFFRWNYDLEIPEWYYDTVFGDHPILAMQIGTGLIGFLPDVMSVYRRHAGGIIMSESERAHHLATRQDWLVVLEGLAEHFRKFHSGYAVPDIEQRMITEMRNFLIHAARSPDPDLPARAIREHPHAFELMISDYSSTSSLRYRLISRLYGRDAIGLRGSALNDAMSVVPAGILAHRHNAALKNRVIDFSGFAATPKKQELWLFMCDDKAGYRGSVRALYEHVVATRPDITPVWLTGSAHVNKLLLSEGLPVCLLTSRRARTLLSTASVVFCESLRRDIFEMRGFNSGTRVVRLLDNQYFRNEDYLLPLALETHSVVEGAAGEGGSPKDWRSPSNLLVTESAAFASRLREEAGSDHDPVAVTNAEPRLLGIAEHVTPVDRRHLLLAPGRLTAQESDSFAFWLMENIELIDELAAERNFVVDVLIGGPERLRHVVEDYSGGLGNIQRLSTLDVYASLSSFAAAVTGPDPLALGLLRGGVPVAVAIPSDMDGHGLRETLAGSTFESWTDAVRAAADMMDGREHADPGVLEEQFGLTPHPDQAALDELVQTVEAWLVGGGRT